MVEHEGEQVGEDGQEIDHVEGLDEEDQLARRAAEPDDVLDGEVDGGEGVDPHDGLDQDVHGRRVVPEAVVVGGPVVRLLGRNARKVFITSFDIRMGTKNRVQNVSLGGRGGCCAKMGSTCMSRNNGDNDVKIRIIQVDVQEIVVDDSST